MTYRELYKKGISILEKAEIIDPENDAIILLLSRAKIDKPKYLLIENENVDNDLEKNYIEAVEKRATHYPLQYILGEVFFYGLKFKVNENVLIPRQDTETLVDIVLKENANKDLSILDICTGTACIAISLKNIGKYKKVVASDISSKAINVACENAKLNGANIDFIESDLFNNINDKFDIIVANPPYIKTDIINTLEDEVKLYEPKMALDGSIDGLLFYRKIASDAKNYLNDNGRIYLEIGYDQAKDISDIFESNNYKNIRIIKDLANNDRVLTANI